MRPVTVRKDDLNLRKPYIELEEAQSILLAATPAPVRTENVLLDDALGRVLAEDVVALLDTPPFDRSPLDGYALCHEDTLGATPERPARLRVAQWLFAGDAPKGPLARGETANVMTGAMLPPGATCVVRQEDINADEDEVRISFEMKAHQNYVFAGEDVKKGTLLIPTGCRVDAAVLGVLATQGCTQVTVYPKPGITSISGGDELVRPGITMPPGKIYDSNARFISARLKTLGARVGTAWCEDDPDSLVRKVTELWEENDLVITTGGVSVGKKDYMPAVATRLAGELLFQGVHLKPGGPALACEKNGKLLLCLSGNPFAAAATFELLGAPVCRKLSGRTDPMPKRARGYMREAYPRPNPGRRFNRARINGRDVYISEEGHASGMIGSLVGCNCVIDVPAGNPGLSVGDEVEVVMIDAD